METDNLLPARTYEGGSPLTTKNGSLRKGQWCQTLSTWILVIAIAFLSAVLIVDIRIRSTSSNAAEQHDVGGIKSGTPYYDVDDPTVMSPPPRRRYHGTQFISFTINTLGGLAEYGECDGKNVDPTSGTCYLGDDDIETDVNHRLMILEEVLYKLRNDVFKEEPEVDRDPGVLKILMMPEFLLRGARGAYSTTQMFDSDNDEEDGLLIKLSDKVRELIFDDSFEDYLFVLGTVIVAESIVDPNAAWKDKIDDANDVMYFNFSPVFRGGANNEGAKHHIVLKKYISGADFLSRTTLPNPSEFDKHTYGKKDDSIVLMETFAKRNMTVVTDNYMEIDGITIGLEICLDHRMGSLWNNLRTKHNADLVDVQLITSAGMSIERGPNPLKHGGVVYLTDGEGSSAACIRTDTADVFDPNNVCRGKPDGIQHIPHGGAGYSSFVDISGCIDMEDSSLLKGYYSMHQPQGCANTLKTYGIDVMDEFKYYPPSLEIYPTIDLPTVN